MGLSRRRFAAILLVRLASILGGNAAPSPQATTSAAVSGPLNPSACASVASLSSAFLAASPLGKPHGPEGPNDG